MNTIKFTVIDKTTGQYPDVEKIALNEDWAKHLMYCDIDSFCIDEDGHLILTDDCGNAAYCPSDKFEVKIKNSHLEKSNRNWRRKAQRLRKKQRDFITRLEVTPLFIGNEQLRQSVIDIAKNYFGGTTND